MAGGVALVTKNSNASIGRLAIVTDGLVTDGHSYSWDIGGLNHPIPENS